eukprot:1806696-Prymnesium_polylepis.1
MPTSASGGMRRGGTRLLIVAAGGLPSGGGGAKAPSSAAPKRSGLRTPRGAVAGAPPAGGLSMCAVRRRSNSALTLASESMVSSVAVASSSSSPLPPSASASVESRSGWRDGRTCCRLPKLHEPLLRAPCSQLSSATTLDTSDRSAAAQPARAAAQSAPRLLPPLPLPLLRELTESRGEPDPLPASLAALRSARARQSA